MRHRILVTTQMMIHQQERFTAWLEGEGFDVDFVMNEQFLDESECMQLQPIYDGWIAGDDQVTPAVIDHLKSRLKVISKWGTGIDSIDKEYAESNGVKVKNSPGAFSDAVGEIAVGYLLAMTRGILDTDRAVRENRWPKKQFRTLVAMKVGLIGMGAIGQGVARRLYALGCDVSYTDPSAHDPKYKRVELSELFESNGAVIVTCNLNRATHHLVNKEILDLVTSEFFLVNVSRGPIVSEIDLIDAIKEGKVTGAALDVFETEPLPLNSGLRNLPGVIFGSHNANNTFDAVEYVHGNTVKQLIDVLRVA